MWSTAIMIFPMIFVSATEPSTNVTSAPTAFPCVDGAVLTIVFTPDRYSHEENAIIVRDVQGCEDLAVWGCQDLVRGCEEDSSADQEPKVYSLCLARTQCVEVELTDLYGDGICCGGGLYGDESGRSDGSLNVWYDGVQVANYAPSSDDFVYSVVFKKIGNCPAPEDVCTAAPTTVAPSTTTTMPTSLPLICHPGSQLLQVDVTFPNDYGFDGLKWEVNDACNVLAQGITDLDNPGVQVCVEDEACVRFDFLISTTYNGLHGFFHWSGYGNSDGFYTVRLDEDLVGTRGAFGHESKERVPYIGACSNGYTGTCAPTTRGPTPSTAVNVLSAAPATPSLARFGFMRCLVVAWCTIAVSAGADAM